MRVFISFAGPDANLAAQLEAALRRNNIETWSSLDVASGEDWKRIVEHESAKADGYAYSPRCRCVCKSRAPGRVAILPSE